MTIANEIRGTIANINDKGIKLAMESAWRNYSRYANGGIQPAEVGDTVELAIDGSGFVRRLTVLDALESTLDARETAAAPNVSNDTLTVRQTCLKVASTFASSRPEMKSSDMLTLAEKLEAWVLR